MGTYNSFTRKVRSPPSLSLAVVCLDSTLFVHILFRLWKENNLPFEPQSIKDGANHLLQLALQLARCVSDESENIRGLLVSFGCTRTNKVQYCVYMHIHTVNTYVI